MNTNTSLAKVESNRRNARLSTGPKTAEGKQVVRWNALKHSLLAREVVITTGDARESRAEFKKLTEALVNELQPVGVLEEMGTESELARLNLPDLGAINRVLRYETTIERQLYRATNQLERLQRQRKGESILPPVNVNLSQEG